MKKQTEAPREHPGRQVRSRFTVGKYEVIAQPIPGSAHMLRYTVFLKGTRIGAMASFPTESDCKFLESPPPVPPVKPFQVFYRPGRPKKGTQPPSAADRGNGGAHHDDLSSGISLPALEKSAE
jgi:hypothetical protein